MKLMPLAAAAALLALATPAQAAPSPHLAPMGFLAGHCWKAVQNDGKWSDEHCFEWVYDGLYLRDRHVVKAAGQPDYKGESLYFWDPEAKTVSYLYVENFGGISRGTAKLAEGDFDFPQADYVAEGVKMPYKARWRRLSDDSYEVTNDFLINGAWVTKTQMTLKRQP